MMQKIKDVIKSKANYILVSFTSSIFSAIFYLVLFKGVEFKNEVEYKDVFTLLLNVIFIFYISRSFNKTYDSERKKKDILIDEVKSVIVEFNTGFRELKISSYSQHTAISIITSLRDETESLKQTCELYYEKISLDNSITTIQAKLRNIDRIINPGSSISPNLDISHIQLIEKNQREIKKQLYFVINKINEI